MFLNVTSALLSTPNKSYSWCFCEYSAPSYDSVESLYSPLNDKSLLQPPAHSRVISSFSSPTILFEESLSCPQRAASCKGSKCNGRSENSEGIKVVGWGIGVKIELHPFEE